MINLEFVPILLGLFGLITALFLYKFVLTFSAGDGKIVEISETDSPFKDVKSSLPEAILSAVPVPHPTSKSKR